MNAWNHTYKRPIGQFVYWYTIFNEIMLGVIGPYDCELNRIDGTPCSPAPFRLHTATGDMVDKAVKGGSCTIPLGPGAPDFDRPLAERVDYARTLYSSIA